MKHLLFFIAILLPTSVVSQNRSALPSSVASIGSEMFEGERITVITLKTIYVFRTAAAQRRHDRLVKNVKKVYPIALQAESMFKQMEQDLARMPRTAQRRTYVARMEQRVQKEYTPVLREMTFSQGKILIKLIDRQTSMTSLDILREFRGKFRASIWQGVAKLFDADLDAAYDASGEDRQIEEIIRLIDAGML